MRRNSAQCNIMMMPGEETKSNKENRVLSLLLFNLLFFKLIQFIDRITFIKSYKKSTECSLYESINR